MAPRNEVIHLAGCFLGMDRPLGGVSTLGASSASKAVALLALKLALNAPSVQPNGYARLSGKT